MTTHRVLRIHATVQEGGQIAIDLPTLPTGAPVEILLLLPDQENGTGPAPRPPLMPRRLIKTAADVELFMEAERAAWDH